MRTSRIFHSYQFQKFHFVLFGILTMGLLIRILFMASPSSVTDGTYYLKLVNNLLNGKFNLLEERSYGYRFLMYLPIAISVIIFGFNDYSVIIPNLLISICTIYLTFRFTLLLKKCHATALLASFFVAIFPLEVFYSTTLSLDVPSSFFISFSLYFYILALKKEQKNEKFMKISLVYLMTGLTLGIAYQIRELSVIIVIFYAIVYIWEILRGKSKRILITSKFLLIAFGFLIIFTFEIFLTYLATGYPFLRYWYKFGIGWGPTRPGPPPDPNKPKFSERFIQISRLERYVISILTPSFLIGFVFYIFVLSLIIIILKKNSNLLKDQKIIFTIIWIFFILLYLEFGTQNPFEWRLIEKNDRFLTTVSVPLWTLIAIAIKIILDNPSNVHQSIFSPKKIKLNTWLSGVILILFICISNLIFAIEIHDKFVYAKPTKEIAQYLNTIPQLSTYVYPSDLVLNLEYYLGYQHPKIYPIYGNTEIRNNSYVIVTEGIYNSYLLPSAFIEDSSSFKWILLKVITIARQSAFPGGFSYNYSTFIYYVVP